MPLRALSTSWCSSAAFRLTAARCSPFRQRRSVFQVLQLGFTAKKGLFSIAMLDSPALVVLHTSLAPQASQRHTTLSVAVAKEASVSHRRKTDSGMRYKTHHSLFTAGTAARLLQARGHGRARFSQPGDGRDACADAPHGRVCEKGSQRGLGRGIRLRDGQQAQAPAGR